MVITKADLQRLVDELCTEIVYKNDIIDTLKRHNEMLLKERYGLSIMIDALKVTTDALAHTITDLNRKR